MTDQCAQNHWNDQYLKCHEKHVWLGGTINWPPEWCKNMELSWFWQRLFSICTHIWIDLWFLPSASWLLVLLSVILRLHYIP
jgi:hypothetical protein